MAEEKKNRWFILSEYVTESSVKEIIKEIQEINQYDCEKKKKVVDYEAKPIELVINTYGGSVYDGLALLSVMELSKTPVHTFCYGKAMSMGFLLLAAGHKRYASPYATLMYHQISTGVWDKLEEIKSTVIELERLEKIYDDYILQHTDLLKEQLDRVKERKQDWFISADEAKKMGIIDEVLRAA